MNFKTHSILADPNADFGCTDKLLFHEEGGVSFYVSDENDGELEGQRD